MVAQRQGRTKQQTRWRLLCVGVLLADLGVCFVMLQAVHGFGDGGSAAADPTFRTDTVDLLYLSVVRVVLTAVFCLLALKLGIMRAASADTLPHNLSESDRAQESRSQSLRMLFLCCAFMVGAISSVVTGIKCIVFDFEIVEGQEIYIAPFLACSIAIINFEFVSVKKLVASYVIEAGVVLSPLHVHKLKYFQVGAKTSKRKWVRGGLLCDVCRDNVGAKPVYNCAQCNFNLCITCFETKSGDLQVFPSPCCR